MTGDPVTTADVWQAFEERLRRFIARRVGDPADAEDILQEVFLRIHQGLAGLQRQDRLIAWIFAIARNAVIDHYRGRRPEHELTDLPSPAGGSASMALRELVPCVEPMVEALPTRYRDAVELVELRGMKLREAAEKLGLSLSGAKSRVQRGREKLRELMLERCHFQFDRSGKVMDFEPRSPGCNRYTPAGGNGLR